MAFWVVLKTIAEIVLKIRKYAGLLKSLSSGTYAKSLLSNFIIGEVVGALTKAGVPVGSLNFILEARAAFEKLLGSVGKDLEKSGIEITLDDLFDLLDVEVPRFLQGHSVFNGIGAQRNAGKGADPVLLQRGEFERISDDLFVRGAGADLLLRRVYRSGADFLGPFGRGWDHSFNLRLTEINADIVTRLTGNLSQTRFVRHPSFGQAGYDYYTPEFGVHDVLEVDATGNFRLRRPGGKSIAYEAAGPLQHRARSIQDAAGNRIDLAYDGDNRLSSVYGNGPHRYLRFSYGSRGLIERVEDHAGRRCTYMYDESGFLDRVEQWSEVASSRYLTAENYEYVAVGESRRVARVSNERGHIIVENEYDTQPTSDTFGYVLGQYTEHGPTSLVYEHLPRALSEVLCEVDVPTMRVFETPPDGHVIERIFNQAGNELLRREDYVEGGRIRTAQIRTRYNEDGAVIARVDPEGGLTQSLFGREHAQLGPWSEFPATLSDVTADDRMAFGNHLATIERGRAMPELDRVAEQEQWIAAQPDVKLRADSADAIVKEVYDPHTQVLLSTSDMRSTVSPDPLHVESAPSGTFEFNPGHPLATAHRSLLTVHQYTATGLRVRTMHPDRSRPPSIGGPRLTHIVEETTAWDACGRPLARRDNRGYVTYWEYYPDSGSPADRAKAGHPHKELRPHTDWVMDPEFPTILEVRRMGSWSSTPRGFVAAVGPPARIRLELHCQRIELWQSTDTYGLSACSAATVSVDGAGHGTWNQVAKSVYVITELAPGPHVVEIAASTGGLTLGRVIGHVAVTFDVDLLGRVIDETNPRGATTHMDYDSLDRVIERSRGQGASMTRQRMVYDHDGDLERSETLWRDGRGALVGGGVVRTIYQRNSRGLLALEVTRAPADTDRRVTRYYHDPRGVLVAARNGRGIMTRWRVDVLGRRVQETRAACTDEQSTTTMTYDRCGRLLRERDPEGGAHLNGIHAGGTIQSGYDARGRIRAMTDPLGHLTLIRHDMAGRETVRQLFGRRADGTFELVERRQLEYDEHGDPIVETAAIIAQPVAAVDPVNAPDAAFLDGIATGVITTSTRSYGLDVDGRRQKIVDDVGTTEFAHDPQGRVTDERLPTGRRIVRLYDGSGNPLRTYGFDPAAASDPSTRAATFLETYRHDGHDRRIELKDAYGNRWRDTHDTLSHIETSTDPLGRRIERRHNAFGQEVQRADGLTDDPTAVPATTSFTYDFCGNLVAIADALGRHFAFSVDALDRTIASRNTNYPADPGSTYAYDRCGRLIRAVDRNGVQSHHDYDDAGRRTRTVYDSSAVMPAYEPPLQSVTFVATDYDARGEIVRMENDWTVITQTRDSRGLLLEERTELKPSLWASDRTWRVAQSFDALGRRTGLVYPSGRAVGYQRDAAGRVTEIKNVFTPLDYPGSSLTAGNTMLARYEYAGGRWIGAAYPMTNAALAVEYDGRGQPIERVLTDVATGQIIWRQQTLTDAARQTAVETATTTGGARSRYFAFDAFGRLEGYTDIAPTWIAPLTLAPPVRPAAATTPTKQAAIDALRIPGPLANTFDFDAVGNRLSSHEEGAPALVSTPDSDNRYVTVGGTAWSHDPEGRLLRDARQRYRYDPAGLIADERELAAGGSGVEFIRDALGRIVVAREATEVHYFAYLNGQTPLTHWRGEEFTEYTAGRDQEPMQIASGGEDHFVIADALRTPRIVLRSGLVPAQTILDYRPHGSAIPPATPVETYAFAGMLNFPGSKVLHTSYRSYLPELGRFIQQDPAGFVEGPNRYVYSRNNPVDLFDPLGLQSFSKSDLRIFEYMEQVAAALALDSAHSAEHSSLRGSNKHLEFQHAMEHDLDHFFGDPVDAERIAAEVWVDKDGVVIGVGNFPNGAPAGARTIDVAVVKEGIPGGRTAIVGHKAEDVIAFGVDYKTGGAKLQGRAELEALLGGKPVVKLTGKAGELSTAITRRLRQMAATKLAKKLGKWGLKAGKLVPVVGFFVTYASNSEASQGERIARGIAGEVGVGPLDLETTYDIGVWAADTAQDAFNAFSEWAAPRILESLDPRSRSQITFGVGF